MKSKLNVQQSLDSLTHLPKSLKVQYLHPQLHNTPPCRSSTISRPASTKLGHRQNGSVLSQPPSALCPTRSPSQSSQQTEMKPSRRQKPWRCCMRWRHRASQLLARASTAARRPAGMPSPALTTRVSPASSVSRWWTEVSAARDVLRATQGMGSPAEVLTTYTWAAKITFVCSRAS